MPSMLLENDFMFSGRGEVPWHGLGAVLDGDPIMAQAQEIILEMAA